MKTKEQRMQERLSACEATLEVIKKQDALSVFGEHGEYIFIPLAVSKKLKEVLAEELTRVCDNLKYHLADGSEIGNT